MIHLHTISEAVEIKKITKEVVNQEGKEETVRLNPKFVRSNTTIIVKIKARLPLTMEKFDVIPQLGVFTLRDEGRTIAVGEVTRYVPYKRFVIPAEIHDGLTNAEIEKVLSKYDKDKIGQMSVSGKIADKVSKDEETKQ